MAPYAPENTGRYVIKYRSLGVDHNATWRWFTGDTPPVGLLTGIVAFYTALASVRFTDWNIISAKSAPRYSTVLLPSDPVIGVDAGEAVVKPRSWVPINISFAGLSSLGTKARMVVFGVDFDPTIAPLTYEGDYRIEATENSAVSDAVDALNAIEELVAIDGIATRWYTYANLSVNAHYQRRLRRA